jgi:hypothetical protein
MFTGTFTDPSGGQKYPISIKSGSSLQGTPGSVAVGVTVLVNDGVSVFVGVLVAVLVNEGVIELVQVGVKVNVAVLV